MRMYARVLLIGLLLPPASCGKSKKSGSGAPEEQPKGEQISLPGDEILRLSTSLESATKASTVWKAKISVSGEEKLNKNNMKGKDLADAMNSIPLRSTDILRVELTATDGNDNNVLATNLEQEAAKAAANKETWDKQCKDSVKTEFVLRDLVPSSSDYSSSRKTTIRIKLCDFTGVLVEPSIKIESQTAKLEKKQVSYKCVFRPYYVSSSSGYLQFSEQDCDYGYVALPGETAPAFHVPASFAPGSSNYTAYKPRMSEVKVDLDSSRIRLRTETKSLPFGSIAACHTAKLDMKFTKDGIINTARVEFKDFNGKWVLQNPETAPSLYDVAGYYNSAKSETVTFQMICEWVTQNADIAQLP